MSPDMSAITGFERATTQRRKEGLVIAVYGRPKNGKTDFGCGAPGPVAIFDFNLGLGGVVEKYAGSKPIYTREFSFSKVSTDKEEFTNLWLDFKQHFVECLLSGAVKSIVIDTATEMYELLRLHKFGKLDKVMPHMYGSVNMEMDDLIQQAIHSGKYVIFNHKVGNEYINDAKTGDIEMKGYSGMGHAVELVCRMYRDLDESGNVRFNLRVDDSRFDPTHNGLVLSGSVCNFKTLAGIVLNEDPEKFV